MILGVGIDLADISRIKSIMERHETRFLSKVFTPDEIEFCMKRHDAANCLAGRFAAKEAAFKALSAGKFSGIGFKEIKVLLNQGRPELELTGRALSQAKDLGVTRMHLSISHDKGCAIAMVVMEGAE
jgi:holo-[acyl-carrier protein] synthase